MACIPPNSRRVGYIVPIHGPLYMGSIYTNTYASPKFLYLALHCDLCSPDKIIEH